MLISVLIPTYNRKGWLLKTLACIARQTYHNFETIVVDASQPEDQLSDADLLPYSFKIQYHRYGIAGNVSKQRNMALRVAKGDILLFLDDDVSFDEYMFEKYHTLLETGTYEAISGLVETTKYPKGSAPIWYKGNPFQDMRANNYQPCSFLVETYIICTANFALMRRVYEKVGGFDELLYGSFDDVDYGLKLMKHGIKVFHVPEVSVFHYQERSSGARSPLMPTWWMFYNACYFQLKNFETSPWTFFIECSWFMLKPSRSWLVPGTMIKNYFNFSKGFQQARSNLEMTLG